MTQLPVSVDLTEIQALDVVRTAWPTSGPTWYVPTADGWVLRLPTGLVVTASVVQLSHLGRLLAAGTVFETAVLLWAVAWDLSAPSEGLDD